MYSVQDKSELFQQFVSDRRLGDVIEQMKRSNDIFNIISPSENQHSEILKWLFNPREGHGQGDAILKDFLTAAYWAASGNVYSNRAFFECWTPSRIAGTGFHSIFMIREYVLSSGKRLDLLMVDADNEVLIVVENKHGSRFGVNQLEEYYEGVANELRRRPAFNGFKTAYIALDRNHVSSEDEGGRDKAFSNRWAYVDYQWLEAGARRAEMQLRRGNQSASLVIAYCQRQTDYVPPEEEQLDDKLALLAQEYRPILDDFVLARKKHLTELTPAELRGNFGDVWKYANHHSEIVDRMIEMESLAFVETGFKKSRPGLELESVYGKRYVRFHESTWRPLMNSDDYWAVEISVWRMLKSKSPVAAYGMAVYYCPQNVHDGVVERLQASLSDEFPELKRGRQDASYRTLGRQILISEGDLAGKLEKLFERTNTAIKIALER